MNIENAINVLKYERSIGGVLVLAKYLLTNDVFFTLAISPSNSSYDDENVSVSESSSF
jgi:hypothetical protein